MQVMSELLKQINSLAIFGGLRQKEPLKSLCVFLRSSETPGTRLEDVIEAYSDFVKSVYTIRPDADFSGALWDALKTDENETESSHIGGALSSRSLLITCSL